MPMPLSLTVTRIRSSSIVAYSRIHPGRFLGLAFKMSEEAAKTWRRIRAPEKVAELLGGARYEDGMPVLDNPPDAQEEQREAP